MLTRAVASAARRTSAAKIWCPDTARRIHSGIEKNINIDLSAGNRLQREVKIVATVGPSSLSLIPDLLNAGMNVMRLNCSHGTPDFYDSAISRLRKQLHRNRVTGISFDDGAREDCCAVALDTKGPEIRTGSISGEVGASVELQVGEEVTLSTDDSDKDDCNAARIWVLETTSHSVRCSVANGGLLGSKKGVNLPGVEVDLPAVSEKDALDLQYAVDNAVDFVFASFIRTGEHVKEVRDRVGSGVRVISKIENQQGLDNFDEILEASDGIMVARGDLGIEIPSHRVFLAQKLMVSKSNLAGKPVICATQMLESMVNNPRPTRAECVDVANAVLDGADSVMLSGETAKGKYPLQSIKFMAETCRTAEAAVDHRGIFQSMTELRKSSSDSEALASSAVHASFEADVKCIIVVTQTGTSARLISKYRPSCTVIAMTPREATANSLQLNRAIHPIVIPADATIDYVEDHAMAAVKAMGVAADGDKVLFMHGKHKAAISGDTNVLRLAFVDQ